MATTRSLYETGKMASTTSSLYASGKISGTQKDETWDERKPKFHPFPVGPIEDNALVDRATADGHYEGRELGYADRSGMAYPVTSHKAHYPPKDIPQKDPQMHPTEYPFPLGDRTEYRDEFPGKRVDARTMPATGNKMVRDARLNPNTTYGNHFPGHAPAPRPPWQTKPRDGTQFDAGSFVDDTFKSTNAVLHDPKPVERRQFMGQTRVREYMPTMMDVSTTKATYVTKPIPDLALCPNQPFQGVTSFTHFSEYTGQYIPKAPNAQCPPLTGIVDHDGIPLPYPRRSLGVQYTRAKGDVSDDKVYTLIPASSRIPCTAKQVFTTTVNDQADACIMVMYGDTATASHADIIGQFDLKNLVPGPKGTARIEVTFSLDKNNVLTVDAREVDTMRQRRWVQRQGVLEVSGPEEEPGDGSKTVTFK